MLSRIMVISMVLSLLVIAISPSLVGAAAAGPVRHRERVEIYEVSEDGETVAIGERNVDLLIYPGEPICQVVSMNMTIDLNIYTWDAETEEPTDLLAKIRVNERLSGEVFQDIWFPEGPDGGLTIDEGVIAGHVVLDWKIKAYTDELQDEIKDNLKGKYNLWFENGVELDISTRVGVFPFTNW